MRIFPLSQPFPSGWPKYWSFSFRMNIPMNMQGWFPLGLMVRSPYWLIGNDPDAGKDWGQEEKGEPGWDGWMASTTQWTWVEQTLGDSEGQGSLACCSPWGCRVWYHWVTEQQREFLWGIKSIFSADEAFSTVFGTYKVFINESHCYYYYWLCVF